MKKPSSKVAHNRPKLFFKFCQSAQNQTKSHFLFHENVLRLLYKNFGGHIVVLLCRHSLPALLGYGLGIKCNNDKELQSGKSDHGELVYREATSHSEACKIICSLEEF